MKLDLNYVKSIIISSFRVKRECKNVEKLNSYYTFNCKILVTYLRFISYFICPSLKL